MKEEGHYILATDYNYNILLYLIKNHYNYY